MPPWVASAPRLTVPCIRRAIDGFAIPLRCRNVAIPSPFLRCLRRSASTHVSPTAINYRPNIPSRNESLYNALSALGDKAERYVSLSRLQLALGGLKVESPVTRVAVLGLNSQISARRLARLLLADPLSEEEDWEKELVQVGDGQGPVLIRFGEESDVHPPSPLYKILHAPSRILGTNNLEILVSTLNINVLNTVAPAATENAKDALLVPKLQATSARGLPVPFPVHQTLVLGEDLDSTIAYGRFTSSSIDDLRRMVKVAVSLHPLSQEESSPEATACPVNLESGAEGLNALRTSIANSTTYEHKWFASGLPVIQKWLTQDLSPATPIKPVYRALISSILDDVESKLRQLDTREISPLSTPTSQDQLFAEMVGYLEGWAEKAHEELRDKLDEAFAGKNWRKLAWWRLFWRVDDVGMVLEEVLERRWLVGAEKEAVYLAGRMKQAGFPDEMRHVPVTAPGEQLLGIDASGAPTGQLPAEDQQTMHLSTDVKENAPWPSLLASARTALLNTSLPPLQALAQRLILSTLSTTSLSAALSALLYISMPSLSLFEASAIAALGLMLSLRQMQRSWESGREAWQASIHEEGRQTLKSIEGLVRLIIKGRRAGGVPGDEGERERRAAREAVRAVREALQKMEGS